MRAGRSKPLVKFTPDDYGVVLACHTAIQDINVAVRDFQSAALNTRDTITMLRRVLAHMPPNAHNPELVQMLYAAIEHGEVMVRQFEAMGAYEPVPIRML